MSVVTRDESGFEACGLTVIVKDKRTTAFTRPLAGDAMSDPTAKDDEAVLVAAKAEQFRQRAAAREAEIKSAS